MNGCLPCSGNISREHYISRAVLDLIFDGGQGIIKGTPWANSIDKSVSKESLTAKILCQRHNSGLSQLDDAAKAILLGIQAAQTGLQLHRSQGASITVSGDALERWFLKVAAGMLASGNLGKEGVSLPRSVPEIWCNILTGSPFPSLWGLYLKPPSGEFSTALREFWCQPMSGSDKSVRALHFGLARIPFTLIPGKPDNPDSWGCYRPSELVFTNGVTRYSISLHWISGPSSGPIEFLRLRDA